MSLSMKLGFLNDASNKELIANVEMIIGKTICI